MSSKIVNTKGKCGKKSFPKWYQEKSVISLKHCKINFPQETCEQDLEFNVRDDKVYKILRNFLMLLHEGGLIE